MEISEKNLEDTIEQALLSEGLPNIQSTLQGIRQPPPLYGPATSDLAPDNVAPGGYHKRTSEDYDKAHCLITDDVFNFIYATQPKEWEKFKKQHEIDAKTPFIQRLASELRTRGTLDVLRKGIKANGCKFQLAYFHPSSGLNYESQKLYAANIFSEVRQLRYSERNQNSLDLVLFLNGLPIFTAELKNPFTGQNVENAIQQYRFDRDPREPLFAFGRCLAHFAVDPDLVYMASHLEGPKLVSCLSTRDVMAARATRHRGKDSLRPISGNASGQGAACSTWCSSSSRRSRSRMIRGERQVRKT